MTQSAFTLRNIFSLPPSVGQNQTLDQLATIEKAIEEDFSGIDWKASMPGVGPKIDGLFDIDISNLLVAAWNKTGEIQRIRGESRKSPEEVRWVELAKHSISSEHHPYVEMTIKGAPPKKIVELTVKLTLTLKGFQLRIQDGAIREVRSGTCEAEGTIEFKGMVIKKQEIKPIVLPGSIILKARDTQVSD